MSSNIKDLASNLIEIKSSKSNPSIIDLNLNFNKNLKRFSFLEYNLIFYPYSREVTSKHIDFYPFHNLDQNSIKRDLSVYSQVGEGTSKIFGLILGLIITTIFWFFDKNSLLSVQSVIAVFGSYAIGKDLWNDLEDMLMRLTSNLRIKYTSRVYDFKINKGSTLYKISKLTEENRYNSPNIYPDKLSYFKEGNSITAHMLYKKVSFSNYFEEKTHAMSMRFDEKIVKEIKSEGFALNFKISLNKIFLFLTINTEIFQSIDHKHLGYIDEKNGWRKNAALVRKSINIGRVKVYLREKVIKDIKVVNQR